MTGAPDSAQECCCTRRGFSREGKAFRGGTAFMPSVRTDRGFYNGHRMAKSIDDSIGFAAKRSVLLCRKTERRKAL